MTVERFYQSALWLPLAVPATIIIGWTLFGFATSASLEDAAVVVVMSLIVGGLPYAVLAIWLCRHMRGKSEQAMRGMLLRAPLWMILLFIPVGVLIAAVLRGFVDAAIVAIGCALAILVAGYAYVGVVFVLRAVAGRKGWITATAV